MGNDGNQSSVDYCDEGEIPKFKTYDNHSGELTDLFGDVPAWTSNGIEFIDKLAKSASNPEKYQIFSAYPNPFNPVTNFYFTLQATSDVMMNIYDLQGRAIATLYDASQLPSGSYSVIWDASMYPSGVYIAYLQVNDELRSQKIVLLK